VFPARLPGEKPTMFKAQQFDSKEYLLPAMKEELKLIKFPPETDEKDLIIAINIFKEHTLELFQTFSHL
jgi:hypothetical protein